MNETTERLTKIDVAERQISQAVRLFFDREDAVSIHTLTAAAYQVLYDLASPDIRGDSLRGTELIKDEYRKEWIAKLKESENFFKHADHDPDAMHEFNFISTQYLLLDSIRMFARHSARMPWEHRVYFGWFCLAFPSVLRECDFKNSLDQMRADPADLTHFAMAIRHGKSLAQSLVASAHRASSNDKPFAL